MNVRPRSRTSRSNGERRKEERLVTLDSGGDEDDAAPVYRELVAPPPSISILEMGRKVTLVGKRQCWSDALLYCRDFHWDLLSIRGPEELETIDELVARANFPLTSHLLVGLLGSIIGSSWFWMSGDPMDFTQWEHGSHQSSPCGSMASMEPSAWRQRSCEEHLYFFCFTGPTEGENKVHFYSSTRENKTMLELRACLFWKVLT
ncbi:hypothetical protein NHX12_014844 [Muraenolepis orangiensis]|uniref:C-type lectin domain-containing protein n=1 Tax=Muraenolepis orangiensis TaxID=630683 RepID=A0A9Q0I3C3_9TELE|nr:hypothetical protein NHX12_014844 [Muraenolepis orangiensis]